MFNSLNAKVAIISNSANCFANQLTGFYTMATLAFNELIFIFIVNINISIVLRALIHLFHNLLVGSSTENF